MLDVDAVESILNEALTQKFKGYNPEANAMPFHEPLLSGERLRIYSFMHSIMTSFGTTIFEPVAAYIAESHGWVATRQREMGPAITHEADNRITEIMNELGRKNSPRRPDMDAETAFIREAAQTGTIVDKDLEKADVYLTRDDLIVPIDIKTAKPNASGFKGYKRTLLGWTAAELYQNPDAVVRPILGIPYNPYEPAPYDRVNVLKYFEVGESGQVKSGTHFWNFLANGDYIYDDLVACFERVGEERRSEIDEYFDKFSKAGPRQSSF